MEERFSNAETEFQSMEGDSTVVLDKVKLHEVVASGSLNFDEWTSLISEVEKAYPDDMETICLLYDSFLSEFPLCYGYWRNYVNHKIRLCTIDKIVEVFEKAVLSVTYSVDLWVDYCNFGRAVFEDPSDICRLFRRALSFVGKDYLCHTLWDRYIEFEFSLKHWTSLAHIYIQTLRFPTKKLDRYYNSFKKLVEILEKEIKSCSNSDTTVSVEPMLDSEASMCSNQDEISCIIKDLLDPSTGLDRLKALQKYVFIGEHFFREASQLNEKINCYEARIRRSYFHVKPLESKQLENWHKYLDFVELHGDFDWAVKLYERCLIPCANYPNFWMRYIEFMESKGGREIANLALDRATQIFLKRESVIHLFNARFKEQIGDVLNARAAFLQCNTESDPDFVSNVIMRANMEKRLGNFTAASNIYNEALEMATSKEKWHILPILYVHFSRLMYMTNESEDAAIDILIDGIKHVPCSIFLMEELIKFATMHGGSRHINMVDAIVANAVSPGPGVSQSLSAKDGEEISKLYLEFVDLCGSLHDVRKAWNRHIRLFPQSVRATLFHPHMGTKQWKMVMEAQEETPVGLPHQPSGDFSSNCLMQSSLQDDKLSSPRNDDTQVAPPATDKVLDEKSLLVEEHNNQESPLLENPNELSEYDQKNADQEKDNLLQLGEFDNNVNASAYQGSPHVPELSGEDSLKPNPSIDLKHQVANNTESPASLEFSKEYDVQKQDDHEHEQDLKPYSLERLSLASQDAKSPGPVNPVSYDSGAPKDTCFSDESVPKCEAPQRNGIPTENVSGSGQDAYIDPIASSPMSTQATVSSQTDIGHVSPSSTSHQDIMVKAPLQPQKPKNNGKNWHQSCKSDRFCRDSQFGFRGRSHKRLQKQRQSSPQRTHIRAEKGSQMRMDQDYPSQPQSSQNLQVLLGAQVQSECPASTVHTNQTVPQAWPAAYNMQQQNLSPACQSQPPIQPAIYPQPQMSQHPMQSNEQSGNAQNNQTYNQMWQYYYYQQQQQQLLWQQQQLLQHQQPQQQQLLQQQFMQMQYLQQQQQVQQLPPQQQQQLLLQQGQLQQQQPYQLQQQQQLQQQHLLYLQQQQSQLQQQLSPTTDSPTPTTSK